MNRAELHGYLLLRLRACNTQWSWLREPEIVARNLEDGQEVDLWCAYDGFVALVSGLLTDGWAANGGRFLGRPGDRYFSASVMLHHSHDDLPDLDIHTGDLRWRHIPLFMADEVLTSRTHQGNDFYLSNRALAWMIITRPLLRGNLIGERLARARAVWNGMEPPLRDQFEQDMRSLLGIRLCRYALAYLRGIKESAPPAAICLLFAGMHRPAHLWDGMRILSRKLRKFFPDPVFSCMFLGTDGSGKSTQIRLAHARLLARGMNSSIHYWGRTRGNRPFVMRIRQMGMRLLGVRETASTDAMPEEPQNGGGFLHSLVLSAGAAVYVADYWLRYLLVRYHARAGEIMLFDRGAYDIAVMRGVWDWVRPIYWRAPQPTLLILCDAPLATIYTRKRERSEEESTHHQNVYREIVERRLSRGSGLILNTTQAADNLAEVVVAAITLHACYGYGLLDKRLLIVLMHALRNSARE